MLFRTAPPTTPIAACSAWRLRLNTAVGGLTEVGFSADERYVLALSHAGRGLFDLASGERTARDDEAPTATSSWIDDDKRCVRGIGMAAGEWFAMVGLWGGSLAQNQGDSWACEVVGVGAREQALLRKPGVQPGWLVAQPVAELRAFGFSPNGRWLLLATSADLIAYELAA